jgi:hypothetical protein
MSAQPILDEEPPVLAPSLQRLEKSRDADVAGEVGPMLAPPAGDFDPPAVMTLSLYRRIVFEEMPEQYGFRPVVRVYSPTQLPHKPEEGY